MIVIYHNPRCSKSRYGLDILKDSGKSFIVIKYLEDTPSYNELKNIISLLKIKPIELVRKNESVWKENFKHLDFTDNELVKVMVKYPQLIERPIVINGDKATIGRPPEKILKII